MWFDFDDVTLEIDSIWEVHELLKKLEKPYYDGDPDDLYDYIEDNWDELVRKHHEEIKKAFKHLVSEARDYYGEINGRY